MILEAKLALDRAEAAAAALQYQMEQAVRTAAANSAMEIIVTELSPEQ